MKTRRLVIAATTALVALSLTVTAFAATQTRGQTGTQTQIRTPGTCVK